MNYDTYLLQRDVMKLSLFLVKFWVILWYALSMPSTITSKENNLRMSLAKVWFIEYVTEQTKGRTLIDAENNSL